MNNVTVSEHLRFVERKRQGILYHALHGRAMRVSTGVWRLLNRIRDGADVTELENEIGERQVTSMLQSLEKRGHVSLTGGPCESDAPLPVRPPANVVSNGALIRGLRLFVTQTCNLGCSYCLVYKTAEKSLRTPEKPEKMMPWPVAKQAIDEYLKIVERFRGDEYRFTFYGGEPLLNWVLIKQALEYIRDSGIAASKVVPSINTNATLLTDTIFSEMIAHRVRIRISLDGVREVNDAFRLTHDGRSTFDTVANKLRSYLPVSDLVCVSVTLSSDRSIETLSETVDLLRELAGDRQEPVTVWLNLPYVRDETCYTLDDETIASHITAAIEYGATKNIHLSGDWAYPFRRLSDNYATVDHCPGMGSEMAVWTDGRLISCSGGTESYGSVFSMDAALSSDLYHYYSSRTVGTVKGCDGCEIQGLCGGGCGVDALNQTGDWYRHPLHCSLDRALFRGLVRLSLK